MLNPKTNVSKLKKWRLSHYFAYFQDGHQIEEQEALGPCIARLGKDTLSR